MRFFSVPAWQLVDSKRTPGPGEEELQPALAEPALIGPALEAIEYRGYKAWERAQELVAAESPAVFARAPNDLPALLRTADQLLTLARVDAGERAQLWRCACGARYAVPVALMRPESLRCERCGATIELDPARSIGESSLTSPKKLSVNLARTALSDFFREAMARGWPVLVSRS
ncbi:MAG: hypothetical protein ACOZQL_33715 [Myxococcota bacterium]